MTSKLPKLVVFDLDYTLWPFYVELQYSKPYRLSEGNIVLDQKNNHVKHYPEVPEVLEKLRKMNVELGLASRTSEIEGANQLVELFGWGKYFKYVEVYPGSKINHFKQFKKKSPYEFSDMLFFDDEGRNIKEVSAMNVTCIHVKDGMSMAELHKGLDAFKNK